MRSLVSLDRAGVCVCGALVQQHFTIRNERIACEQVRFINEALKASAPFPQEQLGAGHEFHRVDDLPLSRVVSISRGR